MYNLFKIKLIIAVHFKCNMTVQWPEFSPLYSDECSPLYELESKNTDQNTQEVKKKWTLFNLSLSLSLIS